MSNADLLTIKESLLELRRQMYAEAPNPAVYSPEAVLAYNNAVRVANRYIDHALAAADEIEQCTLI